MDFKPPEDWMKKISYWAVGHHYYHLIEHVLHAEPNYTIEEMQAKAIDDLRIIALASHLQGKCD